MIYSLGIEPKHYRYVLLNGEFVLTVNDHKRWINSLQ